MRGYSKRTAGRAKTLRHNPTDAEKKLWALLKSRQIGDAKFRRQQPVGAYIVDFFCPAARLVIEADGGQHSDSATDEARRQWLASRGYRVLRFWNHDILGNPEGVVQVIAEALATPHPAPASRESPSPSRGEGSAT